MDTEDVLLMKGNEAIAYTAIRIGVDGYFGYPITPQSEIIETLMSEEPWHTTGMVVLQAESELAAVNMVYGGAACGKMVMTSSSGPGISLKQEGISFFGRCRIALRDSQCDAWRTGIGNYSTLAGGLFSNGERGRKRRLSNDSAGSGFRAGDVRPFGVGL